MQYTFGRINASDLIISIILSHLKKYARKLMPALLNAEFVSDIVSDLLLLGCITQVPFKPGKFAL